MMLVCSQVIDFENFADMDSPTSLQFFSPSYRNDLERFVLLRKSIQRFAQCPILHVVAVPRRDVSAFAARLEGDEGVRIVPQETLVATSFYSPLWFRVVRRMLGKYAWRFADSKYAGRAGWIIQQIVKLSVPEVFGRGTVAILDSDLVFVRKFSVDDIVPANRTPILLRREPKSESGRHRAHMTRAREILKIAPGSTEHHYMAYPAIWHVDWVKSLRTHIERVYDKPWQQVLFEAKRFSEYQLYGIFVDEILKPEDLVHRTIPFEIGVWDRADFDAFMSGTRSPAQSGTLEPLTLVVQSNIGVSVSEYADAIEDFIGMQGTEEKIA